MTKNRAAPKRPRYRLEVKKELNGVGKEIPVYYIKDETKGRFGLYIARIYDEWAAKTALESLNKMRK